MSASFFKTVKVTIVLTLAFFSAAVSFGQTIRVEGLQRPPQDGGARRWIVKGKDVVLLKEPRGTSKNLFDLEPRSLLLNFGCLLVEEQVWCEVQPLRRNFRGFVLGEELVAARGANGMVVKGKDDSKKRAKSQAFDETARIPCAQESGQSLGTCHVSAARSSGGDATLVVMFPNGFKRELYFVHREFLKASATMSGVGRDVDWELEREIYHIRVDDQRFEIPLRLVDKK